MQDEPTLVVRVQLLKCSWAGSMMGRWQMCGHALCDAYGHYPYDDTREIVWQDIPIPNRCVLPLAWIIAMKVPVTDDCRGFVIAQFRAHSAPGFFSAFCIVLRLLGKVAMRWCQPGGLPGGVPLSGCTSACAV